MRRIRLAVLLSVVLVSPAAAQVEDIPLRGFGIKRELMLSGSPAEVFRGLTGDLPWWDHSFAAKPVRIYMEAKPGGCFCEIMDSAGAAVRHATVTAVMPGKLLRFEGALGLAGAALTMVHTYELTAQGDSTKLVLSVRGFGEVKQGWPEIVENVWKHFLVEAFQPWYEKGRKAAAR